MNREDTNGGAETISGILVVCSLGFLSVNGLNFSTLAYGYGTIISCLYMVAAALALVYGTWKLYLYHLPESLKATTAGVLPTEK